MKKILSLVKDHLQQDFQRTYYLTVGLFLCTTLILNYSINLENAWIDRYTGNPIRILFYFLLYGVGYYVTCLLVSHFKLEKDFWRSQSFWIFSLFGLFLLSLDRGFPYQQILVNSFHLPYSVYIWVYKMTSQVLSFLFIFAPLLLFYRKHDKVGSAFYGLTARSNVKPYLFLWLALAPVILLSSLHESFTNYYPVYKTNQVAEIWDWPEIVPVILFELFYGIDFLNVELLFRGFFVLGMVQILGKHAIIPMVTIYCFLHFGKPAGEAISSIFGGYVLGVIALYTRSIWGGILIHVGVAWMMEAAAYVSKLF
ncbi:MAG: CPBP family intramembrane metalloprotease [Cyclobacteriaceae bacterium]|nr:CPBP family intramembrane metalloprotease [Cyclobacteriaceae bacterium]